jgi:hypothetical protein
MMRWPSRPSPDYDAVVTRSTLTGPDLLAHFYAQWQRRVLAVVEDLTEDQLRYRPARVTSIAFNVWHVARWDDLLASLLADMTPSLRGRLGARPELWSARGLAREWGFPAALGQADTGMGIDEDVSVALPLPAKPVLIGYARDAFGGMREALAAVTDADLIENGSVDLARTPWLTGHDPRSSVASWILAFADHANRHLGMIEALRGLQDLRGTASA